MPVPSTTPPWEPPTPVIELLDVLPGAPVDYERYAEAEREKVTPLLEALGYEVIRWCTGDGDSFGPLTRYAICRKDGKRVWLMYG